MIQDQCYDKATLWAVLRMQQFFRQTLCLDLDQDFCETIFTDMLESAFSQMWAAHRLRPDFCTSSPDSVSGVYIGEGCLQHDIEYMLGVISRKEADRKLRDFIYQTLLAAGKSRSLAWFVARIYYRAARSLGRRAYKRS